MEMHAVKSSNVDQVGYDAATRTLAIKFKSGGTYHYKDVAPQKHAALMAAESVGSFIHQHIKGQHQAEKIGQAASDLSAQ